MQTHWNIKYLKWGKLKGTQQSWLKSNTFYSTYKCGTILDYVQMLRHRFENII